MVLAVLLTYSLGTWAQSITLKGIVKDDFGESIIGASVLQKGTTNGTVTDLDGNFTLTVPNKNAVLVISFIGYLTQEITVGNQTHFNVLLKEDAQLFRESANRENIALFVEKTKDKKASLASRLATIEGSAIIYCATRKNVEMLYHELKERYAIGYYHGGLDYQQRAFLQKQFQEQQLQFLIATNAFGMGINKSNIRLVIHYDLPDSMENYMQEIGRAGRDQQQSYAILLYQEGDEQIHYYFQQHTRLKRQELAYQVEHQIELPLDDLQEKWRQQGVIEGMTTFLTSLKKNETLKQQKLSEMLDYIHWQGCRRQRMLASLDESVTRFPAKCCDYHGATMDLGTPTSQKEKRGTKDWQEILQRMFKD